MFPNRYYPTRMFAARYFPKAGADVSTIGLVRPSLIATRRPTATLATERPAATIATRRPTVTIETDN